MSKKLFFGALALAVVGLLASCNSSKGGNTTGGEKEYDATVKADIDHAAWCVAGQVAVGDDTHLTAWDYSENGTMTATSLAGVAEVSTDLADTLEGLGVAALYKLEHVRLGTTDAGWNTSFLGDDGEVKTVNGSRALKVITCNYDDEDDVYSVDEWIPQVGARFCDSLTPSTYWMLPRYEEADENGFSWDGNPAAKAAGQYTVIAAKYTTPHADSDGNSALFGIGLVKEDVEVKDIDADKVATPIESVELIGGFNSWADAGVLAFTQDGNTFTLTAELPAGPVKARLNSSWKVSYGFADLTDGASLATNSDGNIGLEAGTYTFSITFASLADQEAENNVTAFTLATAA